MNTRPARRFPTRLLQCSGWTRLPVLLAVLGLGLAGCMERDLPTAASPAGPSLLQVPGVNPFTQVSGGFYHTCALRSDGVAECWGWNVEGQAPATRSALSGTFTQVSAGVYHTCALRSDGVAECWGRNVEGQAPATRSATGGISFKILPAATFRATPTSVVAGEPFTLALDSAHVPGLPVTVHFTYAFDCGGGSGYGPFGTSHTATCPTSTAGTRTVRGTVRDHHGDQREYTQTLTVSPAAPAPPTDLVATAASGTEIDLAWSDNSGDETSFQVQRRTRDIDGIWSSYVVVASPAANATSHSDTGLSEGTRYRYRIRACNAGGCSAWAASNQVTTPIAPPAAPSHLTATVLSATEILLGWTDESDNESHFRLQRRMRNSDGTWGSYSALASPPLDATTFTDSSVAAGARYQYRIRACNLGGCSAYTPPAAVTTP
jgi:hypothetical protein